jgi:hypothetical protein
MTDFLANLKSELILIHEPKLLVFLVKKRERQAKVEFPF